MLERNNLSLKEIQSEELKLLKVTRDYFERNSITYILAYGSLLGTVRHKGFIPWDDDVDLLVPRKDYEKLRIIASKNKVIDGYIEVLIPAEKGFPTPYIKIVNKNLVVEDIKCNPLYKKYLWLDVFPLDYMPDDKVKQEKIIRHIWKLNRILAVKTKKQEPLTLKRFAGRIVNFIYGGSVNVARIVDNYANKINTRNIGSHSMACLVFPDKYEDCFDIDLLFPTILAKFEDDEFYIPQKYEEHLKHYYGEYMLLPPENERVRHNIKVYRK